jgi:hypothetical protein
MFSTESILAAHVNMTTDKKGSAYMNETQRNMIMYMFLPSLYNFQTLTL